MFRAAQNFRAESSKKPRRRGSFKTQSERRQTRGLLRTVSVRADRAWLFSKKDSHAEGAEDAEVCASPPRTPRTPRANLSPTIRHRPAERAARSGRPIFTCHRGNGSPGSRARKARDRVMTELMGGDWVDQRYRRGPAFRAHFWRWGDSAKPASRCQPEIVSSFFCQIGRASC